MKTKVYNSQGVVVDNVRSKWAEARGVRYGNRRKEIARLKKEERRTQRKRDKRQYTID